MSERFTFTPLLQQSSGIADNGKLLSFDEVTRILNQQHQRILELENELSEK